MQTIPYNTDEGIIELVRKTEYDRLKWELEEQCAKLAKWQAMAGQLAERLNLWHNAAGNRCNLKDAEALAAYESAASGRLPDQLIEHCRQAHDLLRLADVAINQAADLAAATETTDSQHSLAGRLLAPFERASKQIRGFISAQNDRLRVRQPDPLAEAVKRMEAVPVKELSEEYGETLDDELHSFEDRDEPLTTDALIALALEAVRARLIQAAKNHAETPASTATGQ